MAKKCKHERARVHNTRPMKNVPNGRWRRYHCMDCPERWTTIEMRVDVERGGNAFDALRKSLCITKRQHQAIGELIQAFLEPNDEQ